MHLTDAGLIFSATDLSNFLACPHLTLLARRAALGEGPKPPKYDDPSLEVLWQRGLQHERNHLEGLRAAGKRVVELSEPAGAYASRDRWTAYAAATVDAMRAGADVIYQGALFDGTWIGKVDFLTRVETPSQLGAWSYEVVDTKLAREAKGGALLQVLLYAELLAGVQGAPPALVHIALGGPEPRTEMFRVADYAAYFRSVRDRFLHHMHTPPELAPAPEPVEHCAICAWSKMCADGRRTVDHLSLVAGISRSQRRTLDDEHEVATLEALAQLEPVPARLARVQAQARIQLEGRRRDEHVHELLRPVTPGEGLAALPSPSAGDLFFDLEGDPHALTHGIEYLFGFTDAHGEYTATWALDRDQERRAFERFIDMVMARLERWPDLHVYHYNHYETTALKRLMGRYATRLDARAVRALVRRAVRFAAREQPELGLS